MNHKVKRKKAHEESMWRFYESSARHGVENEAEDSIWGPDQRTPPNLGLNLVT